MANLRRETIVNDASTDLNGAINASVTSITVTDGSVFPSDLDFRIIVGSELMKVTQVATNTLTVVRGVEGSTAASHADAATVTAVVTKDSLINLIDQSYDFAPSNLPAAKIVNASDTVLTSSSFTWFNQGTATVTDESNGNITLTVPNNSSSNNWRGLEINPGSTPWTITAFIAVNFGYVNASTSWGMFMRETSSGDFTTLVNRMFSTGLCEDWTSATTFSAQNANFDNAYDRAWFRLSDDGTNVTFEISVDGYDFFEVHSEARGTFFTTGPDRVGIVMNGFTVDGPDNTASMSLISWSQT